MKIVYFLCFNILFSCTNEKVLSGDVYFVEAKYTEAIRAYEEILTEEPDNLEARFRKSKALFKAGELSKAFSEVRLILMHDYKHLESNKLAAEITLSLNAYDLSLYYSKNAVLVNDTDALAYFLQARAFHEMESLDMALSAYDKAIKLRKYFKEAYFFRGLLFIQKDDLEKGISNLNTAKALGCPNAVNILNLFSNGF